MHTPDVVAGASAAAGPGPAHRRLAVFLGTWDTEGEIVADAAGQAARLRATDSYEWLPGGFFLLHRVEGRLGDDAVRTLEVIGHDAARGAYFSHAFDDRGHATAYEARLEGAEWTITGATVRFSGTFADDGGALAGAWERRDDDGRWVPWMTIRLTKRA